MRSSRTANWITLCPNCARSAWKPGPVLGDVADIEEHAALLDEAEAAIRPLTTLVNNAGVSVLNRGDVLDVTPESDDRCQAVKRPVLSDASLGQANPFAPGPRGPASLDRHALLVSAVVVSINRGEYCASKTAPAMMAKVFAVRLGAEGIGSYDIRPGIIETPMTAPAELDPIRGTKGR
jgi:3-oxoacyl-[acyl-carrier protein] reductase